MPDRTRLQQTLKPSVGAVDESLVVDGFADGLPEITVGSERHLPAPSGGAGEDAEAGNADFRSGFEVPGDEVDQFSDGRFGLSGGEGGLLPELSGELRPPDTGRDERVLERCHARSVTRTGVTARRADWEPACSLEGDFIGALVCRFGWLRLPTVAFLSKPVPSAMLPADAQRRGHVALIAAGSGLEPG